MAKKTSTKTSSPTRTAAASKPGKSTSKASISAAFAKRTASSITGDIRSLAAEVKDLRSLRAKYDQLLAEHHGLVGANFPRNLRAVRVQRGSNTERVARVARAA